MILCQHGNDALTCSRTCECGHLCRQHTNAAGARPQCMATRKRRRCSCEQFVERAKPLGKGDPDWSRGCENCAETPVVNATGLCGPCTFGEADTAGGNW